MAGLHTNMPGDTGLRAIPGPC